MDAILEAEGLTDPAELACETVCDAIAAPPHQGFDVDERTECAWAPPASGDTGASDTDGDAGHIACAGTLLEYGCN